MFELLKKLKTLTMFESHKKLKILTIFELHEKFSHQVRRANTPAGLDCDVSDEARRASSMVQQLIHHIQSTLEL